MMELGRKKEGILLLGIVLAALAIRLTTYKYEYLLGIDPLHHYRIAEHLAEKGQLPAIWPLSLAPTGAAIREPAGLYYISVLLYRLLGPFGFSFVQAFKLAPAIFGAFALVPIYLLAREFFDRRAALYSSFILAFLPAFIYRAFAGFYRGDVFSVFFMLWGFYFFLASLEGSAIKRAATSVLAGLSLGLMGLVWNGFLFGFGVLTLAFLLISTAAYRRRAWSWSPVLSYALSVGLGVVLIRYAVSLYPNTAAPVSALAWYIYPGGIALSSALGVMDRALRERGEGERALAVGLLALASVFILQIASPGLLESLATGYGAFGSEDPILGRVGELRGLTLTPAEGKGITEVSISEKYGLDHLLAASGLPVGRLPILGLLMMALPALAGFVSLVKRAWKGQRAGELFLFGWTGASLYLLVSAEAPRFAFLAAPALALLWGHGLQTLRGWELPDRIRYRWPEKAAVVLLTVIPLLAVLNGAVYASERAPDMDTDWQEALTFLKGREAGVVLSWWSAGSWVQGVTGFPTVVDSVHGQRGDRVKEVAKLFLENNTRYGHIKDFLEGHGVRYIVVSSDLIYYLGDIQAAADASGYNYSIMNPSGTGTLEGKKVVVYGKEKNVAVFRDEGGIQVLYLEGGKTYRLERVHYREKEGLVTRVSRPPPPILEGGVYATKDFIIYATPRLEGALLNSLVLLDGEGFGDLKQIYSNPRVRIYEVVT